MTTEDQMQRRMRGFLPAILTMFFGLMSLSDSRAVADDCLASPNAVSPPRHSLVLSCGSGDPPAMLVSRRRRDEGARAGAPSQRAGAAALSQAERASGLSGSCPGDKLGHCA